jgi:RND family efflux transporter MFP subunit
MNPRNWAHIGCGALTLFAAGCQHHVEADAASTAPVAPPAVSVTVAAVESRAVQRIVPTVGTLHGFEEITLTPEVEGRVLRVLHDVSDRIEPGELLIELDSTPYELAHAEAERALELELAKLGLDEPPADSFDISTLPSVARANLLLSNAERKKARLQPLRAQKVATEEAWDQAQTDYDVAAANLDQARLEAETTLAAVKQRQAVLNLAKDKLSDTKIFAPAFPERSGKLEEGARYVVAERLVSEGEMVRAFPSTAVMRIVIDNPLKLTGPVPERYMGEVKVGQTVQLKVEAYPEELFDGIVTRVNPTVDRATRTFEIEAHIDNQARRLKAGGFAQVGILTRVDNAAQTVPMEAVVAFAGVTKVFEVRDGKAFGVPVKTAEQGRGWIEVVGELTPGAQIVTSGQSKLADGTEIRIQTEPTTQVAEKPAP